MGKTINMSCHQVEMFKRERYFELYNEKYLRVVKKNGKGKKEFSIELISLSPDSARAFKIAWRWFAATIGFLVISASVIYYLVQHFSWENALYLIPICLLSLLLAVGSVYLLLLISEHKQIFYTTYGDFPLVEILAGKPDKKSFNNFVGELNKKINTVLGNNTISTKNLQAGEMKMLRRLSAEGILSRDEYDQAKAKIFGYIDTQEIVPDDTEDGLV